MQNSQKCKQSGVSAIKLFVGVMAIVLIIFSLFCTHSITKNSEICNGYGKIPEKTANFECNERNCTDENVYVHIGGNPIGIAVSTQGLIVVGTSAVPTKDGDVYPTKQFGIEPGDILIEADGIKLTSIYQLKKISQDKKKLKLIFLRKGETFDVDVVTALDKISGEYRIGLMLKEDIGGVGTLTFVTQDGKFAALGHCIIDGESGLSEELNNGFIYNSSVDDVVKGEKGKAGGLVADVNRLSTPIGEIECNTEIGIYGKYEGADRGDLYRIALKGEAKIGRAQILTTIDGTQPKLYDIDIVKVISQNESAEKGMVISVRDNDLLSKTGGIVQGMSGSPIIQNGILIGAVTHVFVQDPTRGYAVHSRFMYDMTETLNSDILNGQNSQTILSVA